MIAQVIVDVSAYPVDRPFDYLVPVELARISRSGLSCKSTIWSTKCTWFYYSAKRMKQIYRKTN